MENNFKTEIISPEKKFFSDNVEIVKLPSYEGDMSILKDHIHVIAFLKPGIITIRKSQNTENFFIEDGVAEFSSNNLVILSTSVFNVKDITRDKLETFKRDTNEKLKNLKLSDEDKYLLYHKLEAIKVLSLN